MTFSPRCFPAAMTWRTTRESFSVRRRCDPAPGRSSLASRTGLPSASTKPSGFPDMSWIPSIRGSGPVFVLVDSDSQRMSKRDELLGLNEFLAHLAKSLIYADTHGRPTIGILYGHSAAGALLATGLATRVLVGLPGATPAVMDLPSMAKVTKLSMEALQEKAKSTPVFAPGLSKSRPHGRRSHHLERCRLARRPVGPFACGRTGCAGPAGCARQGARRPIEGRRNRGARS